MAIATLSSQMQNQLLATLPKESLKRLEKALQPVRLESGTMLYSVGDEVRYAFFPQRGCMVSLLAITEEGDSAEVGVVGYEGAVGLHSSLGGLTNSFDCLVQLPGEAWKVRSETLLAEFRRDQALQNALLRYMHGSVAQISQTALCNRLHTVEERLARWLLLCADRMNGDYITLTHEMLGKMLGTRRSTVSLAAATLQQAGLLTYNRGRIAIRDRKGLLRVSCTCYAMVKKQFEGLYG